MEKHLNWNILSTSEAWNHPRLKPHVPSWKLKMKFEQDFCLNLWYDPISYFGKMNSTLGSVVPLAMFHYWKWEGQPNRPPCIWWSSNQSEESNTYPQIRGACSNVCKNSVPEDERQVRWRSLGQVVHHQPSSDDNENNENHHHLKRGGTASLIPEIHLERLGRSPGLSTQVHSLWPISCRYLKGNFVTDVDFYDIAVI